MNNTRLDAIHPKNPSAQLKSSRSPQHPHPSLKRNKTQQQHQSFQRSHADLREDPHWQDYHT